ncbi:MetQ/NlpA family ABC transporter substrate-binding protein, partial [Acinetobacter schindleri]
MKKLLGVLLSASVLTLTACGKQEAPATDAAQNKDSGELQTVTMASTGSDADIWRYIATLPETEQAGIKLDVKNFTDYVSMNTAVANKEIDVNAFQSYAYMVAYNDANTQKIAPLSTTYLEPMGIYSSKVKKVEDFKTGATIAIPNDGANESRALLLLQSAGLVKLK